MRAGFFYVDKYPVGVYDAIKAEYPVGVSASEESI
jgi:hypothetical protein